jgi:phosphatidylserine/phosphatidylglycerophosphate/cardiolipin synthase-like enzyme
MSYKFLSSPWKNDFINIISKANYELFVSSPFIDVEGVKILSNSIRMPNVKMIILTNFTTKNIVNGFTEPADLLHLFNHFNKVNISSLGRLHAKIYLVDDEFGVITSSNLTNGGLIYNFEYGVLIDDKEIISSIKEDMLKYYSLGNVLDKNLLEKISEEINK